MRPTDTEPTQELASDERKTRELCTHERDGVRCMRPKNHVHEHAAYTSSETISWE
jgi:hypothetical protein